MARGSHYTTRFPYRSNLMPARFYVGPKVQDEVTGFPEYGALTMLNDYGERTLADGIGVDMDKAFQVGEVIERTPRDDFSSRG
jgi:hypothetical protein